MAGSAATPSSTGVVSGTGFGSLTPQQLTSYYGNNPLPGQVTFNPSTLFNGLGPAQLDTSAYQPQTIPDPTTTISGVSSGGFATQPYANGVVVDGLNFSGAQNGQTWKLPNDWGTLTDQGGKMAYDLNLSDFTNGQIPPELQQILNSAGLGGSQSQSILDAMKNTQNNNLASYNAVNSSNADNAGYLQQAAIAQNRLLGELNSRGLLQSFENGGMGMADMQQLQNSLNSASQDQGLGLSNEINGLNQQNTAYQLALANYQNELGNFNQAQQNNIPGITDILGLGASALPLILGA